ncbi:MAG: ATPase, T2SS/T4P/T4SS family [Acidimicrobiales bacterium]|jgi:Flp pilus assembly CpaF family ATPase
MTMATTGASARFDLTVLRLAREIRAEVAEAIAARPGGETTGGAALTETARRLVGRALDERVAGALAAGGSMPAPGYERAVSDLAIAMLFGLGVLQLYVDDPSVENIDVNGAERAYVTYADGRKELVGPVAESDEELIATVRAAGARFGLAERRFDSAQPELDLRLPDGSRLSAVMSVTERPVIDIRRHRLNDHCLADLVDLGMLDDELATFLAAAVRAKRNLLVSGAMNAGKTTLLRALAAEIPSHERIVTIEQALELALDRQVERHPDCVAMEARLPNIEGVGSISMAQLVRRSLRMNASRVIVGEVLGDEVIPMLNAMSQGRSGSMATIHADSSVGVFRRIAAYAVQAPERLPLEATNLLIAGSIHFVVHVDIAERPGASTDGAAGTRLRQVASVREVVDSEGPMIVSNEIWKPDLDGRARPAAPLRDATAVALAAHGYDGRHFGARRSW